jgi:perosamine synthetase
MGRQKRPLIQPAPDPELPDPEAIPGREPTVQVQLQRIPVTQALTETSFIPVCEPALAGNELEYVTEAIRTNWISSAGRYIPEFERTFAAACDAEHGVACTNGTTALHLAMAVLDLGPDDEVILPTFTMIATPNCVRYTGARPVLVDSETRTWNLDLNQVADAITPRTRAIVPVHTYGHPVDMDALREIADEHGLWVVEDAAEAHGARYKGRRVGGLGDAACFSFYGNKIITTGEGGMITTNNEEIAGLARNLRDHAFSTERHFWHRYLGFNYRMTNLQAAVGVAQTEKLDDYVASRRRNAALYTELLADVEGITTPPEVGDVENVFWMYGVLVDPASYGLNRNDLREALAARGIETRTFFIPIHYQPIYFDDYKGRSFPVAERFCADGLYLPSASSLTSAQVRYVVGAIREIAEEARG